MKHATTLRSVARHARSRVGHIALAVATASIQIGAAPAAAVDAHPLDVSSSPSSSVPGKPRTIEYASGGVGIDDVARMKEASRAFNVRIRFADRADGSSLSDVKVVVLDDQNEKLLSLRTDGPLLYMRMPPGRYKLEAVYRNMVQERVIIASKAGRDMTIYFNINELEDSWIYCAGYPDDSCTAR